MIVDLQRIGRRLRYWSQTGRRHQLLQEEMQFHVDSMVQDLIADGMPALDAQAASRRKFGNLTQTSEQSRSAWIAHWIGDAVQDLRYTFRTLRHDMGFTLFAVLIVGLGIGASSTIFSVVNALLLRPLPYHDPSRLVWLANDGGHGAGEWSVQVGHFLDFRDKNKSFSGLAAYFGFHNAGDVKLSATGEPERLSSLLATQNFFSLLGVRPFLGRTFTAEESHAPWNAPPAVLLSYSLWKNRFAADPAIVGRRLTLNDAPVSVVGVLPASFDFAAVFSPGSHFDLYFPFPLTEEANQRGNTLSIVGRLKPGVSLPSAQAEAAVLGQQILRQHPERNDFEPRLSSLANHVSGRLGPALFVLACAVGAVMLIVCANLSNLQLARTASRQKEMALRIALGAGRRRLIRQLLTESVVLSCCGAVLGLIITFAGTSLLSHLDAFSIPLLSTVRVDAEALAFTLLTALLTGVLFGLAPAVRVPNVTVYDALKEGNRGSSEGKSHSWIRGALVVSEIAFACVLLVGSGLLIRSFLRVVDVKLGFQPERAVALRIDPGAVYSTQAKRNAYFDEALRRVRSLPGIEAAGLTDVLPLVGDRSWGVSGRGQVYPKGHQPEAYVRIVSDGYLKALGISLRAGRDLTMFDSPAGEQVALINETMARVLWPGRNAIGQMLTQDGGRRVVGIVGDVRHGAVEDGTAGSEMYIPLRQTRDYSAVDLVFRTSLPPAQFSAAIRNALRTVDPTLPVNEFRTLQQFVDKAVSPRRFLVLLLAGFSGFALLLASLGIYGVISYSVDRRTQEIGIRMALGASARNLQASILFQTLRLAAIGISLGAAASWLLARTIGSLLFEVTPGDPATFLAMLATLTAVAAIAGYVPARRASRIDPMLALRAN